MAAHGEFAILDPDSSFHGHILGAEEAKCPGTLRTEPSRSYSKASSTRNFGRLCLIHSVRSWALWSHRICQSVGYESVLAVASGFGIAGVIPYLRQLLYGYNTSTSRVRRVHFVWQVATLGKNALL